MTKELTAEDAENAEEVKKGEMAENAPYHRQANWRINPRKREMSGVH